MYEKHEGIVLRLTKCGCGTLPTLITMTKSRFLVACTNKECPHLKRGTQLSTGIHDTRSAAINAWISLVIPQLNDTSLNIGPDSTDREVAIHAIDHPDTGQLVAQLALKQIIEMAPDTINHIAVQNHMWTCSPLHTQHMPLMLCMFNDGQLANVAMDLPELHARLVMNLYLISPLTIRSIPFTRSSSYGQDLCVPPNTFSILIHDRQTGNLDRQWNAPILMQNRATPLPQFAVSIIEHAASAVQDIMLVGHELT